MATNVDSIADSMSVAPASVIKGEWCLPGDKSIAHRAAILCGLAHGESTLRGYPKSEDCLNTLQAVQRLGAEVEVGEVITVRGVGGRYRAAAGALNLGNSGTGLRLLTGVLAGHAHTNELTGDASLRSRPMARIRDPLEQMGATIELLGDGGTAPIRVTGGGLRGIDYDMPMASAQVKSAVLLAGLFAEGATTVMEPYPTRDHTERLLGRMGCPVRVEGHRVSLVGQGAPLKSQSLAIPGDFSSAAFWITIAAATPDAELRLRGVGLNPRRVALMDILRRMGAKIDVRCTDDGWESVGDIHVRGGTLKGTDTGGAEIPNVIDELPLVAVAGALAEGKTTIRDAAELRVKETDRLDAMATNLTAVGVAVEVFEDGMCVQGGASIAGGVTVDSFGDHRIAMAMAVLALRGSSPLTINNVACVDTSYPEFWTDLEHATGKV